MEATKGKPILALGGIDQQNFNSIQLVQGAFPYQIGLQKRIPGKSLIRVVPGEVGSIYTFYNVHGRFFSLVDFGTLQIDEIVTPPIIIPPLPPESAEWLESFSTYDPVGLISRLWGGGQWSIGIGVCESIIQGVIDPFLGFAALPPGTGGFPGDGGGGPGPGGPAPGGPGVPYGLGTPTKRVFYGLAAPPDTEETIPIGDITPATFAFFGFIPHPYIYDPVSGLPAFSANEIASTHVFYNSGGNIQKGQTSSGYYTENAINLSHVVASEGDLITLFGKERTIIDRFGSFTERDVEVLLGIFPHIPATYTVITSLGPMSTADVSSPPGSNFIYSAGKGLTYTGFNVYPHA